MSSIATGIGTRAGRGGPREPRQDRDWLWYVAAVALLYLSFLILANGCASKSGPKIYVSDPDFTCPGTSSPGAAVRGQAGECLPYRETKGAYIVFPKDVDIWILQAKQRLGLPKEQEK